MLLSLDLVESRNSVCLKNVIWKSHEKKQKKKANDQADQQCIIHAREEAKGDVNLFLLNSWQLMY